MAKLYLCNTIYKYKPVQDINPLILEKYKDGQVLVLCARDAMVTRIKKMINSDRYVEKYPDQVLTAYGWWEADIMGLVDEHGLLVREELAAHDAVVIVSKDRVDSLFQPLLEAVEHYFR